MPGSPLRGSTYLLPNDASELTRLNDQHKYLKKCVYDDRLIYKREVQIGLGEGSCVLDSGTGTGIWLQELSEEVPKKVQLYGIDVSERNFPEEDALPDNVHLSLASITNLPEEWTNSFDVVNQRFLIVALLAKDWPVAVSEIFRVLKPGGSVQLAERETTSSGGRATTRHYGIMQQLYDRRGLLRHCATALPGMLEAAGFVDIMSEEKVTPIGKSRGEDGVRGFASYGGAYRNMGKEVVKEGLVRSAAEYEEIMREVEEEWNTSGAQITCRMICARKPTLSKAM